MQINENLIKDVWFVDTSYFKAGVYAIFKRKS